MKRRVFVIGLDGATLSIIKPLTREGGLPNFARLMKSGSYGPLRSSIPPITPCAWTSFATGKHPSRHGLYDFNRMEGDPENSKAVNRTFVRSKSLWKILSEAGKRCVVIDVPLTYPPEEINGVLVSRVMAPDGRNCTYPKSLFYSLKKKGFIKKGAGRDELRKQHGADAANKAAPYLNAEEEDEGPQRINKDEVNHMRRRRLKETYGNMKNQIENNVKLASWLMEKEDWDFFMIVFMHPDYAGHTFWQDGRRVRGIYKKLDWAVGELFKMAPDGTDKFIMSDHGFTTVPYSFNVNEWLYTEGLLEKKLDFTDKKALKETRENRERLDSGAWRKKKYPDKLKYIIVTDYARTRAYLQSGTSYGIRINLKGRDKYGVVPHTEYEALQDRIIKELNSLVHPISQKRVFGKILRKEELYPDSHWGLEASPDIYLLSRDMEVMFNGHFSRKPGIFKKTTRGFGFHHIDGIFFAQGRDIGKTRLTSPHITDLAPTILHLLDVPIPEDMDGRALGEILDKRSPYRPKEISYQGPSQLERPESQPYSKEEREKVEVRLKQLGYI